MDEMLMCECNVQRRGLTRLAREYELLQLEMEQNGVLRTFKERRVNYLEVVWKEKSRRWFRFRQRKEQTVVLTFCVPPMPRG